MTLSDRIMRIKFMATSLEYDEITNEIMQMFNKKGMSATISEEE